MQFFYFRKEDKKKDSPYKALKDLTAGNLNKQERAYSIKNLNKEAKDFYFNGKPFSSRYGTRFWMPLSFYHLCSLVLPP